MGKAPSVAIQWLNTQLWKPGEVFVALQQWVSSFCLVSLAGHWTHWTPHWCLDRWPQQILLPSPKKICLNCLLNNKPKWEYLCFEPQETNGEPEPANLYVQELLPQKKAALWAQVFLTCVVLLHRGHSISSEISNLRRREVSNKQLQGHLFLRKSKLLNK